MRIPHPLNLANMVNDSALPLVGAMVNGVLIIGRVAVRELLAVLPEQIRGQASGAERCLLPFKFGGAVVAFHAIFFEKARLSSSLADLAVRFHPAVAPGVVGDAPYSIGQGDMPLW